MLIPINVYQDNYIWVYGRGDLPVIVIDMGQSSPIISFLKDYHLSVESVLLTHYHQDHIAGIEAFKQAYPKATVFGPQECQTSAIDQYLLTHGQQDEEIYTSHYQINVLNTGGHTAQHVSYLIDGILFCGDTLFSAGCGRVFTGDYQQMFDSLQIIKRLPSETLICPGHEYTLSNLEFALAVADDVHKKQIIFDQLEKVKTLRAEHKPSLPTTLALEKEINPFLQANTLEEFIHLRKLKDNF